MNEKRFIIKNSNTVSSNYPSERVYDNKVKRDLYNSEIVIMLNKLWEENEQLRKIGVMYQGHNPCETCTYCLENKVCCAEPVLICDDEKKNFIQGLCKKHKQFQKSIRRYDDE